MTNIVRLIPSSQRLRPPCCYRIHARLYSEAKKVDHRASSKLFQDAAQEDAAEQEAQARSSRLTAFENQHDNWTGEESMQDAVLRMLVDKYKPLRTGPIRSADEKLKQAPPKVGSTPSLTVDDVEEENSKSIPSMNDAEGSSEPPRRNMANVPLLPAIEGHQPWHTTFHVPSHSSSIKYGDIPAPPTKRPLPASPLGEQAKRKEREMKKRAEHGIRLSRARESTLDYRLGLKGWASLVEERIERARQEGQFQTVKGRGQPLQTLTDEKNPFIAREEFLMNRIVQRNGAAPPWVEIQGELESATMAFRDVLRQSWTRRAIRMLTLSQPPALLPKLTLADVTSLRDTEWEARERAYHDAAVEELNALVRKYNGLAPYAVRRPYYMRNAELEKAYRDSAEDILRGIAKRANTLATTPRNGQGAFDDDEGKTGVESGGDLAPIRLRDILKQWLSGFIRRSGT
ncbi:unnamed protein product [Somion occarium]|uniref:DnaJ homologue subfamily C member 28 conserved domain-containing protein n=1 Tax=Somion occarium TaxID=3059160 RepID=A0ABP1D015_9APHY